MSSSIINWSSSLTNISNTSLNSTFVQVGIDKNGNVVFIWLENGIVRSSNQILGQSFSTPTSLSNSGATSPHLVVDSNGNATAIWIESGGNILTSSQPFGGSWSTPYSLNASGGSNPSLAVDTSGNVIAIWVSSTGIQSNTKLYGNTWATSPDVLSSTGGSSPQLSIGSSGYVIAVWYALNNQTNTIYSASKQISGTWSASTAISNASQNSVYPQIAVDSNGNALCIWYTYMLVGVQYTNVILQYSKYTSSTTTWATPANISTPSNGLINPALLKSKIIYSPFGTAMCLWTNSVDGSNIVLYSCYYNSNNTFLGVNQIAGCEHLYSFDVGIDIKNNLYLLYMYDDTSTNTITIINSICVLNTYDTSYWSSTVTLSNGNQNGYPSISMTNTSSSYYGVASWISYNGSNSIIQYTTGSGSVLQPPTNLSVVQNSQNYGLFQEYYNTLSWSSSSSTSNYLIYRNSILINNVPSYMSSFEDRNATQNGTVQYSIASVNGDTGELSSLATVNYP